MKSPWFKRLTPVISLVLFLAAAWFLNRELRQYKVQDILDHLKSLPAWQVGLSGLLTFLSYFLLIGYDTLGLRFIGRRLSFGRTLVTSFIGYVFSHNLTLLAGSAARYRIYSAWGFTAWETAKIVLFCGLSYWVGFLGLGSILFLIDPIPLPASLRFPIATTHPLGTLFILLLSVYLTICAVRREPLKVRTSVLEFPSLNIAALQVLISTVDWVLGGAVVYALLPTNPHVDLSHLLQVFLVAQCAGMLSHVPGGLGVFETVLVILLSPHFPAPVILGSLVAYRGIYYIIPFGLAAILFGVHETRQRARR